MTITVVGLGPGSISHLTLGALQALQSGRPVLLRTAIHPTVNALKEMGIRFKTCDDLYEAASSFEELYTAIADRVLEYEDVVFAVPGHPLVGEKCIKHIQTKRHVEIITGPSFLDALFVALNLDPADGLELHDAHQMGEKRPSGSLPTLIMQLHSRSIASDVKLILMERYPDQHPVMLIRAAGIAGEERVVESPLYELDHHDWVDYLTTLYIPPLRRSVIGDTNPRQWSPMRCSLDPLVEVMAKLRGPDGCPWDREQTHLTLRKYMLEEAYEAVEAINGGDPEALREELGDVLLQVVFHAQVAREHDDFDLHDIIQGITAKLVRRHPHVFGNIKVDSAQDVVSNWESIKRSEKGAPPQASLLGKTPNALPSLSRAYEVQRKAAQVGFDWDDLRGPVSKIKEELEEVISATTNVEEEIGDLLFAVVNLSRMLHIDPEVALTGAVSKFVRRFGYMEMRANEMDRPLAKLALEEMDRLWDEAKEAELGKKSSEKKAER